MNMYEYVPTSMSPISLIKEQMASEAEPPGESRKAAPFGWPHINRFPKDLPIETRPPWAPNLEDEGQVGVPKPS